MSTPSEGHAEDDLLPRCLTALEHGGYWRATLRSPRGRRLDALLTGQPLMSEWRLPRVPDDDPSLALVRDCLHIAMLVLDDPFRTGSPAATRTPTVRIAPGLPADWSALEVGDRIEERSLGAATLTEYVPTID